MSQGQFRGNLDIVTLTVFDNQFTFLRNTLGLAGMRMWQARTLCDADFLLTVTGATVLLSDVAVVDCCWHAAADLVRESHPSTPLIILADPVDTEFLEPAFELGVWGVLWRPVQFDHATKLIRSAHEASEDRKAFYADRVKIKPESCGSAASGAQRSITR